MFAFSGTTMQTLFTYAEAKPLAAAGDTPAEIARFMRRWGVSAPVVRLGREDAP